MSQQNTDDTRREDPVIVFDHVSKVYDDVEGGYKALNDINLTIDKGDIFGIIGLSGAGKSTLVRCINGIEKVTSGRVVVEGNDIAGLGARDLRSLRRRIGMIFQSFNLMPSRTALDNVELALTHSGLSRADRRKRASELLGLVELGDRLDSYPADLSGGQRQRVGIARALANNPDVILSDEATSALDPLTTSAILDLLARLNRKLGITIVVITHQISVVKRLCNKVAVIQKGRIVEKGDVYSVFADPQAEQTRQFVENTSNLGHAEGILDEGGRYIRISDDETVVRLRYRSQEVSEALISQATRRFGMDFNILFADVSVVGGAPLGGTVVAFRASGERRAEVLDFFRKRNIVVDILREGKES